MCEKWLPHLKKSWVSEDIHILGHKLVTTPYRRKALVSKDIIIESIVRDNIQEKIFMLQMTYIFWSN